MLIKAYNDKNIQMNWLLSSRPISRPEQTQSNLLAKNVKNEFGADIKIILAPPHPTPAFEQLELDF